MWGLLLKLWAGFVGLDWKGLAVQARKYWKEILIVLLLALFFLRGNKIDSLEKDLAIQTSNYEQVLEANENNKSILKECREARNSLLKAATDSALLVDELERQVQQEEARRVEEANNLRRKINENSRATQEIADCSSAESPNSRLLLDTARETRESASRRNDSNL